MASLKRYDGTITTYSQADLEQLAGHLELANTVGCSDGSVYYFSASPYLVLVDLAFQVNRKLSELFQAQANPDFPFNLAFISDSESYSLQDALLRCAYAGPLPETADDLPSIFMAIYQSSQGGGNQKAISVGTTTSLVANPGGAGLPAQIRGLIAGRGIQLGVYDFAPNDITIAAIATPLQSIGTGTTLIDPSSTDSQTYIKSIQPADGGNILVTTANGTITLNTIPNPKFTSIRSPANVNIVGITNSGVNMILGGIYSLYTNDLLLSCNEQDKFVFSKGVQFGSFTASGTAIADNFFVKTDTLPVPSGTQFKALSDLVTAQGSTATSTNASVQSRLTNLETTTANFSTSATVTALTSRVTALETSDTSQSGRLTTLETANTSVTSRVTALENGRATTASVTALTGRVSTLETTSSNTSASLTTTNTNLTNLTGRVATTETTFTNLNNRVFDLETYKTSSTTSINTLTTRLTNDETTIAYDGGRIDTINSTVNNQASLIAALQAQVLSLGQTVTALIGATAASGTQVLPYARDDADARAKGIPKYSLYRNSTRSYAMRLTADSYFEYRFTGAGNFSTPVYLDSMAGWTIEMWVYIPRLYYQSFCSIITPQWNFVFGISGGGALLSYFTNNSSLTYTLSNPPIGTWLLCGVQYWAGSLQMWYKDYASPASDAKLWNTTNGYQGVGQCAFMVGADPNNASTQSTIVTPRLTNDRLYPNLIAGTSSIPNLSNLTSFPLDTTPGESRIACLLDGDPPTNIVKPSQTVTKYGTVNVQPGINSIENFVYSGAF
jgi:uncharacterized coiled-coil protein SlyX